jgi:hypothetical protein
VWRTHAAIGYLDNDGVRTKSGEWATGPITRPVDEVLVP